MPSITGTNASTSSNGPIGSVQGLSSGIQWQDLVDQTAAIDKVRQLDPITARITANQNKETAWNAYATIAQSVTTAMAGLRDGTAIDSFQVSVPSSATTGRALLSASASAAAVPGTYQAEVLGVAKAEKLSGGAFASATTALGLTPGGFAVDGMMVSVTASDTLSSIRDKINALNVGTNPSGVTATVLTTANGSNRLVLSSDASGAHGIELVDSATSGGVLQQLGLVDGTYAGGSNPDGTATSGAFTSTSVSIGQLLGLTPPAATTIRVGNVSVAVDLSVDTLDSLAAKITAAGVSATTVSTTDSAGVTRSRLQVGAALSATPDAIIPTSPDVNSQRVLQMLGVLQGGRSSVAQTVGSTALTDAGNLPVTGATLLSAVKANGASANIQAGDTVTLSGRRGDGVAVSFSFAVAGGTTMNDLVTQINSNSAFGGGARGATASVGTDGKLHLADSVAGDSQLTLNLGVTKSGANGGGSTSIGAFGIEITGRQREVTAGSDAQLRVDGVLLTRSSNTVSDAIAGVTLSLQQAEVGTTVSVNVSRNVSSAVTAIKGFASAYNSLIAFVKVNTAAGADLANDSTIKASARAFTNALLTDVIGASVKQGALIGVSLDKTGVLQVDQTALTTALANNPAGVKSLFALSGATSGTGLQFLAASDQTQPGTYTVAITQAATQGSITGSAATFPYVAGGSPTHLSVTDRATSTTDSIVLANGDTASAVAMKLNTMFSARRMLLSASVISGQLSITSSNYGTAGSFALAYDVGDVTSASQLGLAAGTYTGLNVAGTINGVAATGLGQSLSGTTGNPWAGLALLYTGTATGAIGTSTVTAGLGEQFGRMASSISAPGSGSVALSISTLDLAIATDTTRSADVSNRLALRKAALLAQFNAMESAIQRIQAMGSSITSSLNALTALQTNK